MKRTAAILFIGLLTTSTIIAQGLAGSYAGNIQGTPATLTLQQQGATLNGSLQAGGYQYALSGTAQGTVGQGTLADPQTGGSMPFEIALQGAGLTLTILASDPNTGQMQRVPFQFQRGGGTTPVQPQGGGAMGASPGGYGNQVNVERNPQLVGTWRHTETMISGDYSMVSQVFLQVNADGTYVYGNGRVTAGGENDYGSIHGDTGRGGTDSTQGQWRTQGNIVYIMEGGQWVPYARYYIEGGTMMFTFGDGSKQLWHRQ